MTKVSKRKPTKPRTKAVKAWAVFTDGAPLIMASVYGAGLQFEIYKRKRDCNAEDVRRVHISIAPTKGKRK